MTEGRRAFNKAQKEEAIREAARALFTSRGFDATTLRDVASAAGVGFGTVFAYATDKAGLLAMVFVEELGRLPPLFPERTDGAPVGDELVDGLMLLFRFWGEIPHLAPRMLQEMEFFGDNAHVGEIRGRREQVRLEVRDWVLRMQAARRLDPSINAERAAATVFALYTSCVREWAAAGRWDHAAARTMLAALLELPLAAMIGGVPARQAEARYAAASSRV